MRLLIRCIKERKRKARPDLTTKTKHNTAVESLLEKIFFSMEINCMSLAVWLGEEREYFATVVGFDLELAIWRYLW